MTRLFSASVALAVALTSMAVAARPPLLVDAEWLEEHIDDSGLVILEVRYHPHRYFTLGHIPGAMQVQRFKDLGDNDATPNMRFSSREALQASLRRWGVNDDSTILIYDDARTALAARLYYLLELYGFDRSRIKILDGGTIEWTVFQSLEKTVGEVRPGTVTLQPANSALYAEWPEVYDRVISRRDPAVVLLDARPEDQYTGETVHHSVRGGHIPGAINVVSQYGTDPGSHKWVSREALANLYAGIPKDKTIIVYCHDGFRSSQAYLQLKSLGYAEVRVLNGGWGYWGNALTLPVVEGNEVFGEEFDL